jgi:hypothetical protein
MKCLINVIGVIFDSLLVILFLLYEQCISCNNLLSKFIYFLDLSINHSFTLHSLFLNCKHSLSNTFLILKLQQSIDVFEGVLHAFIKFGLGSLWVPKLTLYLFLYFIWRHKLVLQLRRFCLAVDRIVITYC